MRKPMVIAVLVLLAVSAAAAADESTFEEFPRALGFVGGRISGTGLSYQRWNGSNGFMVAAGAVYVPETTDWYWGNILDYSIGVEYQRSVYGEDFTSWLAGRLYLFSGLNHSAFIRNVELAPAVRDEDDTLISEAEFGPGPYTPSIGLGVGIGIEIVLFRHFSVPVEFGYAAFWYPLAGTLPEQLEVNLVVQGGFRYRY